MITTESYKLTGSEYFKIIIKMWLGKTWWAIALIFLLLFALLPYDMDIVYVILMVIFLIIPSAVFYLWFVYALRPMTRLILLDKQVRIDTDGFTCLFENAPSRFIPWESVIRLRTTSRYMLIYTGKQDFFYVPYSAFRSPEDKKWFFSRVLPHITR
ncbi:MAG: hypothetical protein DBY16_05305 [Coprobacter sp.]|jgi:hypothetical protein|nr:YcxB family protein [Barnesiella sp. GGCC_0306]MBS7040565.1 YcxB family protein [Bacteroidales bacterium]PWM91731.1 MAG: hypothetical protein DBY16_05305 [Coprobacter sp.]